MKLLVSHLTGNANVKAVLRGFMDSDLLKEFYVSLASTPGTVLDSFGGIKLLSEIRRRRFDPEIRPFLKMWPWLELCRLMSKGKLSNPVLSRYFSIDKVIQNFDKHVSLELKRSRGNGIEAVYCYEDMSIQTFSEAKKLGIKCIYDLPIGYWRAAHKLLAVELAKWPQWADTMHGLKDSSMKLSFKDEELSLADYIFVASTFTANTLKEYSAPLSPIKIIPYGFPSVNESKYYQDFKGTRPLKLLFVGSLSQRKGIADLIAAVESFGSKVELTLVGKKTTEKCLPLNKALAKYRWIPSLSHADILEIMRSNDVFVFPSLFEGFGLVITEAMSQGTPVITTERTAGPDIIDNNENGWIIKAGCVESLKKRIDEILTKPSIIKEVGRAALEKAKLRPWKKYGDELADAIKDL